MMGVYGCMGAPLVAVTIQDPGAKSPVAIQDHGAK